MLSKIRQTGVFTLLIMHLRGVIQLQIFEERKHIIRSNKFVFHGR